MRSPEFHRWPLLPATRRALDRLKSAVDDIIRVLPKPELKGDPGREWFQIPEKDQTASMVMALKAVRVVSGLNAAMRLGEHGYTQEMAVLFRTVDDFIDEVSFLLAGEQDGAERRQQDRFVDEFFSMELLPTEDLLRLRGDIARVSKKKIRAGHAGT